jgi:hypothetical protein
LELLSRDINGHAVVVLESDSDLVAVSGKVEDRRARTVQRVDQVGRSRSSDDLNVN